jgi:hypothetical protein
MAKGRKAPGCNILKVTYVVAEEKRVMYGTTETSRLKPGDGVTAFVAAMCQCLWRARAPWQAAVAAKRGLGSRCVTDIYALALASSTLFSVARYA